MSADNYIKVVGSSSRGAIFIDGHRRVFAGGADACFPFDSSDPKSLESAYAAAHARQDQERANGVRKPRLALFKPLVKLAWLPVVGVSPVVLEQSGEAA